MHADLDCKLMSAGAINAIARLFKGPQYSVVNLSNYKT